MVDEFTWLPTTEIDPVYSVSSLDHPVLRDHTSQHPRRYPGGGKGLADLPASSSQSLMTIATVGTTPNIAQACRDVRRQAHGLRFVGAVQALSAHCP